MIKKILIITAIFSNIGFANAERLLVKKQGVWKVYQGDANSFLNDPLVEWVEKDIRYHVDSTNDPSSGDQWSLQKSEVFSALELANQQTSQNPAPILVAVIDTGVDLQHPDLKNNLFINEKEIPNNGIDDDHNGLVDDVQGYNFAAKPDDQDHNEENPTSAQDDFNHGSHVAGIIGAIQNNHIGISGIAPHVKILPIRWMIKGSGWGSDAIEAIHYAVKMGARIINTSWGGIGYSKALEEAVREAESKGILFVASAGNNKTDNDTVPRHPANLRFSNVISVANTDEKDVLAKSSNFGLKQVELAAPGENILSTILNQGYGKLSGTSMAAPHVSGIAALLLSINPNLTAQEIKKILMETATQLPSLQGKTISGGRVNALEAVKKVIAQKEEQDRKTLSGVKPFYEFGEFPLHQLMGGDFIKPDHVIDGETTKGLFIQFVRMVKGQETPVEGLVFKAQLHAGGGTQFQKYESDENGRITDNDCQRSEFNVTATMESTRYSVSSGGQAYDLVLKLKCGVAQKIVFDETSDSGEVTGIWQVAKKAEKKLEKEIGLAFWKSPIEFIWPAKGDYYDGSSVHLTFGHQWDVVSHEMGHAIYDQGKIGVFGGGEHYIDRCYGNEIALSEGWASFYAAWLNFDLNAVNPGFEYMVPRRAPITVESIPADVCGEPTNEWRVIGFLWDLIDLHDDQENYSKPFSKLWNDTKGIHASSIGSLKTHLIDHGWDSKDLESIWKLNFPAASATF